MSILKNNKILCIILFIVPFALLVLALGLSFGLTNADKKTISFGEIDNGQVYIVGDKASKNSDGTFSIAKYSDVEIVIVPEKGYKISKIFVGENEIQVTTGAGDRQYVKLDRLFDNVKINVEFSLISYNVLTSADENGTITETFSALYGETKVVTITPNSTYKISKILVNGEEIEIKVADGESQQISLENISSNYNISATFEPIEYKITNNISNPSYGNISVQSNSECNKTVTFTVLPKYGYTFDSPVVMQNDTIIPITNGELANTYTFTMPAGNVIINVTFNPYQYTIKTETSETTYSVSKTTGTVGEEISIIITPQEGYCVDEIIVKCGENLVEVTDNKFVMPAGNVTVKVTFKKIDYSITKLETENGAFDVATSAQVNDVVEILINPDTGFVVDKVTVKHNEESITVSLDNKFIMPAGEVVVSVTFKAE